MAGITIAGAAGILKEFYTEGPVELLNNATVLWAQLERNGDEVNTEGSEAVWATHVQRNWGVGFIADGGTLPTAGNQKSVKGRAPLKTLVGRAKFTVQTMRAARSNRSAFEKAATSEMNRLVKDLKRQQERAAHGTSNGVITQCGTTTNSTTVVLASTDRVQFRQLEVGMNIDIGTVAAPFTIAQNRQIQSINSTAGTMVISGAPVTTSALHFIFLTGAGGDVAGVGQLEPTGIQTICAASGSLFSIDPATYPMWAGYADIPGTDRPVSELLFMKALDEISMQGNGDVDLGITTPGVKRALGAQMMAQKNHNDTLTLKGGFKALSVDCGDHHIGLVGTKDCVSKKAFLMTTDVMKIHEWQPWEWMDDDGSVLSRVSGEYAYEAVYGSIFEVATTARNAHGIIGNLVEA